MRVKEIKYEGGARVAMAPRPDTAKTWAYYSADGGLLKLGTERGMLGFLMLTYNTAFRAYCRLRGYRAALRLNDLCGNGVLPYIEARTAIKNTTFDLTDPDGFRLHMLNQYNGRAVIVF